MPKRYFLALVAIAVVFVLALVFLFSLISSIGDDGNDTTVEVVPEKTANFIDNAQEVTFTKYGSVVASEQRRAIRFTINDRERVIEVLKGYDDTVIKRKRLPNTSVAYDNLKVALNSAAFSRYDTSITGDERASCVTGIRYVFEVDYDEKDDTRSWATSCSRKDGSFRGDRYLVEDLVEKQFPDYNDFVSGVDLVI